MDSQLHEEVKHQYPRQFRPIESYIILRMRVESCTDCKASSSFPNQTKST